MLSLGFTLCWLPLLQSMRSVTRGIQWLWLMGLVALWHVRSSQTWDQTVSSALAGGFLTTGPLGKSHMGLFKLLFFFVCLLSLANTQKWSCWIIYGTSVFNFLRNFHSILSWWLHQFTFPQCMRVPFSPYPQKHVLSF